MASAAAYDAIKAALAAAAAPIDVLDYEAVDPDATQGAATFIALQDEGGAEGLGSIGAPDEARIRETGRLTAHVFLPAPRPASEARALVDNIRDALRHRRLEPPSGGEVAITNVSPAFPLAPSRGLWAEAEFDIEFRFDFLRAVA